MRKSSGFGVDDRYAFRKSGCSIHRKLPYGRTYEPYNWTLQGGEAATGRGDRLPHDLRRRDEVRITPWRERSARQQSPHHDSEVTREAPLANVLEDQGRLDVGHNRFDRRARWFSG